MRAKWAKQAHHRMNAAVREMNKVLQEDELWKGRFYIHEKFIIEIYTFDDHSGGELTIMYEMRDRKTGKTKLICLNNYNYDYHLWLEMNNFIVDYVDVWSENPRPHV